MKRIEKTFKKYSSPEFTPTEEVGREGGALNMYITAKTELRWS